VLSYWSPTGEQLVLNGTGRWSSIDGNTQVSGSVAQGHPVGTWHRTSANGQKVLITETFAADGTFKSGRLASGVVGSNFPDTYRDESRLSLAEQPAFTTAEKFQVLPPCRSATASTSGARAANSSFVPAVYKQGASAYWELVWIRLRPLLSEDNELARYNGVLQFKLNLDERGNWQPELYKAEGTNLEAARQLLRLMRLLPRWEPAHENGQPVASSVQIEYRALPPSYSLRFQPLRGTVGTGFNAAPPAP
jgi:hypothetical protein